MRQLDDVKAQLEQLRQWRSSVDDAAATLELYDLEPDDALLEEANGGLQELRLALDRWELERLLSGTYDHCLLYTSPSPRDLSTSRMPSSA